MFSTLITALVVVSLSLTVPKDAREETCTRLWNLAQKHGGLSLDLLSARQKKTIEFWTRWYQENCLIKS